MLNRAHDATPAHERAERCKRPAPQQHERRQGPEEDLRAGDAVLGGLKAAPREYHVPSCCQQAADLAEAGGHRID
eukprot:14544733-Alexandrium_andersonii.AAC.1